MYALLGTDIAHIPHNVYATGWTCVYTIHPLLYVYSIPLSKRSSSSTTTTSALKPIRVASSLLHTRPALCKSVFYHINRPTRLNLTIFHILSIWEDSRCHTTHSTHTTHIYIRLLLLCRVVGYADCNFGRVAGRGHVAALAVILLTTRSCCRYNSNVIRITATAWLSGLRIAKASASVNADDDPLQKLPIVHSLPLPVELVCICGCVLWAIWFFASCHTLTHTHKRANGRTDGRPERETERVIVCIKWIFVEDMFRIRSMNTLPIQSTHTQKTHEKYANRYIRWSEVI